MSTTTPSEDQAQATSSERPSDRITAQVTSWPGVKAGLGERGEWAFTVGEHSLGHLHGDRVAHFGFPRELGARLREEGRVGPHPVNRHSTKMAARQIAGERDIEEVIALLRLNYERIVSEG